MDLPVVFEEHGGVVLMGVRQLSRMIQITAPICELLRILDVVILCSPAKGSRKEVEKLVSHRLIIADQAREIGIVQRKRLCWIQTRIRRCAAVGFWNWRRRSLIAPRIRDTEIRTSLEGVLAFGPAQSVRIVSQRGAVSLLGAAGRASEVDCRQDALSCIETHSCGIVDDRISPTLQHE